jgi:hypothetical protein
MQLSGERYHALAKDEQCFCAAKVLSRPCLRWVKTGKARYEHRFSALPLKADITLRTRYVRFVPNPEVAASLDHLVDERQQGRRYSGEAYGQGIFRAFIEAHL